jgi:surface protein
MFANCSSLVNLDLSDWNVEGSDSLASMFSGCTSLETLDLSNWNTSTIVTMNSMFNKCSNLRLLNLGDNFVMTKVTNKASMFLQSFSVSNSCVIVCSNEIQSKLKSGTSLTSSFVIFKTPAQYEAELPSVLFILNDDTVDGFNLNALVDEEFEEISN